MYESLPDEDEFQSCASASVNQETLTFPQQMYKRLEKGTLQCVFTFLVVFIVLGLTVAFYFYCTICLFFVVILCLCCCLCIPGLNLPLWIAIVLLWFGGYSLSNGHWSMSWGK
jgi:hypothetical protein